MDAPRLSPAQQQTLLDELADALDELLATTCPDMVPLWLQATETERREIGELTFPTLDFRPSERYFGLSDPSRSKYRGLAAWRHAVLWQDATAGLDTRRTQAVRAMYFTPFPANVPPYAWSQRASEAPGVEAFPSATVLKERAREGCRQLLDWLRGRAEELRTGGGFAEEVRGELLRPATRDSVFHVLKLDGMAPGEPR